MSIPHPDRPLGLHTRPAAAQRILMACPWGPVGGGMYRVVDYLIAHHTAQGLPGAPSVRLEGLDTRGQGSALSSAPVLLRALGVLLQGKLRGDVAGVHIHLAERLSLVRKGTLMLACRALGLPMIVHLHAAQFPQFYQRLPAPARWLTRWLLRLPAGLIVLGQSSHRFVTEVLQVPAERVSIVLNGVPAPQLPRRIPGAFKRVLFVGNLSERKGVSDLLQALCLPGWDRHQTQVVLAGGGDIEGYRLQAQALGLADWVEFTGWLDQAQVAQQMARADVLVLPSYDEGLPLVILEAMAQGVAVVCTPVGEIGQVIADGQQALFVTAGDVPAIAHQLQQVLSDETLRNRLEQAGRALYTQRFSMATFQAQIAALHRRYFGLS